MSEQRPQRDTFLDHLAVRVSKPQDDPPQHFPAASLTKLCNEVRLCQEGTFETRQITSPYLKPLGLALMGYGDLKSGHLYLVDLAEQAFLKEQPQATDRLKALLKTDIAGLIWTGLADEAQLAPNILALAQTHGMPLFTTHLCAQTLSDTVFPCLDAACSPKVTIHGNLIVYRGLGLLLLGRSGLGKSDCALDLIANGCQLVADDMVQLERNSLHQIIGRPKPMIKHHMDVRGIGIINIRQLFSIHAVQESHPLDLIIYLEPWDAKPWQHFAEENYLEILGIPKPLIRLPSSQGRNWNNLVEVAVRNFMLKTREGYNAETQLADLVDAQLKHDPS